MGSNEYLTIEKSEEYMDGMDGTKWKIFCCAVHNFAETDYTAMSMRQIAESVGIRASSIYNHFESKEAILQRMYKYIRRYSIMFLPDLNELMQRVDTDPPREVLMATYFHFPDPLQELMSKMILASYKMIRVDPEADELIKGLLVDLPVQYIVPLLKKMVKNKKIEPLDIEGFTELYTNNFYGASMRMHSSHPVDEDIWQRSFSILFEIVQPIDDPELQK